MHLCMCICHICHMPYWMRRMIADIYDVGVFVAIFEGFPFSRFRFSEVSQLSGCLAFGLPPQRCPTRGGLHLHQSAHQRHGIRCHEEIVGTDKR